MIQRKRLVKASKSGCGKFSQDSFGFDDSIVGFLGFAPFLFDVFFGRQPIKHQLGGGYARGLAFAETREFAHFKQYGVDFFRPQLVIRHRYGAQRLHGRKIAGR